jgi:thiamine-phosphate pyrophosphorylase
MRRYAISNSRLLGGVDRLPEWVATLDRAGVDFVQIREKELSAAELARVVAACLRLCRNTRLLVNTRVDVALACGAHGAHLPGDAPSPDAWRGIVPAGFVFGVSCHSEADAVRAEAGGAGLIVASPVFDPLSKVAYGEPLGLAGLARVCRATSVPVYALGGVTMDRAPECVRAGAAGVAGITLFLK